MPNVSVIIPVYNVEKYLERCLDSILNQTYQDFEIICVNDCSLDSSNDILKKYTGKYFSKIKLLENSENSGQGFSRDKALEVAQGKFIMYIDSDDYIAKDYIKTYLDVIENKNLDLVIGGYIKDMSGRLSRHKIKKSVWSIITYPLPVAKIFRKSFLKNNEIKFGNIRCGEDILFSVSVFYYNPRFKVIDYEGYYYYNNPTSTTSTLLHKKNHEKFVSDLYREFLNRHSMEILSLEKQEIIEYSYVANMINALLVYNKGADFNIIKEKYDFAMRDLEDKFPNYKKNKFIGISIPKGQTLKIGAAVNLFMYMKKWGFGERIVYIFSRL